MWLGMRLKFARAIPRSSSSVQATSSTGGALVRDSDLMIVRSHLIPSVFQLLLCAAEVLTLVVGRL